MANELRVRTNFLGGLVGDNPLLIGASAFNSAALVYAPVIGTTQHFPIVIDPDGLFGSPEIVYIITHGSGASVATIVRAREGTIAREHPFDVPWIHGPTIKEFDGSGGGSGLIALKAYRPSTDTTVAITSTAWVDVDAANLVVFFIAPPSGKVLVALDTLASSPANTQWFWGLREGTTLVANSDNYIGYSSGTSGDVGRRRLHIFVKDLTPGVEYTWKWAAKVSGGTGTIYFGNGTSAYGTALMEVLAVNV